MTYDEAYAALCDGCWREKECHEDLCYCDAYLKAAEEVSVMEIKDAIKMLRSKMDGSVDTSYEWCETIRLAIKALEVVEEIQEKGNKENT